MFGKWYYDDYQDYCYSNWVPWIKLSLGYRKRGERMKRITRSEYFKHLKKKKHVKRCKRTYFLMDVH